jgi:hypothetical protein
MSRKVNQSASTERKHLKSNGEPFTDIGEVIITQTMFGKVKIQEIHNEEIQSRPWLLIAISVTAIAAAAWFGWTAMHQAEPLSGADPLSNVSSGEKQSTNDSEAENNRITPPTGNKSKSLSQTEINNPKTNQNGASQRHGLNGAEQKSDKAVTAQSLNAGKSQTMSNDTNNSSTNQVEIQQKFKVSPHGQPTAPTTTTSSAISPAANTPVAEAPLVRDEATQPPAGDKK